MRSFPEQTPGRLWLTEPGVETEILYRMGYELPEFSMLPLLENRRAIEEVGDLYRGSLEIAAREGWAILLTGFDYHASPRYGAALGYSPAKLADLTLKGLDTLRGWVAEFEADLPDWRIVSCIGPRGDAYGAGGGITEAEAEDYHATQIATVRESAADLVVPMTFNNIPEAIGVTRAAMAAGAPVAVSFTLTTEGRLRSGPTLREAIETTDATTGSGPLFYMVNCAHPTEYAVALEPGDWRRRLRGIRPNAVAMEQVALCKLGHIEDGDPVELGGQLADLARTSPWMDIWGGCCGTGNSHISEIARQVGAVREIVPA